MWSDIRFGMCLGGFASSLRMGLVFSCALWPGDSLHVSKGLLGSCMNSPGVFYGGRIELRSSRGTSLSSDFMSISFFTLYL